VFGFLAWILSVPVAVAEEVDDGRLRIGDFRVAVRAVFFSWVCKQPLGGDEKILGGLVELLPNETSVSCFAPPAHSSVSVRCF